MEKTAIKRKSNRFNYKGYDYEVLPIQSYHCVVICKGYEICAAPTVNSAQQKFEALIDSGLTIYGPRVIGEKELKHA